MRQDFRLFLSFEALYLDGRVLGLTRKTLAFALRKAHHFVKCNEIS